jgi:flagellar motor switch protein FliG
MQETSTTRRLTGKQKVALLMVILGVDDASNITQYMNPHDVRELARLTSEIKSISKKEIGSVLREFMEMMPDETELFSFDEHFSSEIIKRAAGEDHFFSLDLLQRSDKKQLIEAIQNEHPQVVAFILSYLPFDKAGEILSTLSSSEQADIAYRISTMESPNPIALKHLDHVLGEKLNLLSSTADMEVGGVDSLVRIMRGVGRKSERVILENLENLSPDLSREIKSRMFIFEDIVQLDNRSVQKVLKDVNMNTLALALKKCSVEISDLIMSNLSERARAVLVEDISVMQRVPLRDVEAAQQEIVEIIRRMEEAGDIVIRKEEEEYV